MSKMLLAKIIFSIHLLLLVAGTKVAGDKDCIQASDPTGSKYRGKLSTTKRGFTCQRWDASKPHKIKFKPTPTSADANFCRNPGGKKSAPWCYTTNRKKKWQLCNVPKCNSKKEMKAKKDKSDAAAISKISPAVPSKNQDTCGTQMIAPAFTQQRFVVSKGKLIPKTRFRRIIGGEPAVHGSWPWMVSISISSMGISHWCGGTLISPSWILTGGHCFRKKPEIRFVNLLAGHHTGFEPEEQWKKAKRYIVHPDFDYDELYNDVALIQLEKPFKITDHVRTACLPPPNYIVPPNTNCVGSGWGATHNPDDNNELKQVVLPVQSYITCVSYLGSSLRDKTHMCAGLIRGTHDTCPGDSGGPLMCLLNGRWTIQGITSWSYQGCKDKQGDLGAYSRVSKYRAWIDQQMKLHN